MRLIGLAVIVLGAMITVATNASVANGQMPSRLPLIAILEVGRSHRRRSGGRIGLAKRVGWVPIAVRSDEWRLYLIQGAEPPSNCARVHVK